MIGIKGLRVTRVNFSSRLVVRSSIYEFQSDIEIRTCLHFHQKNKLYIYIYIYMCVCMDLGIHSKPRRKEKRKCDVKLR